MTHPRLCDLQERVPPETVDKSKEFAKKEAGRWHTDVYHPSEIELFVEKGFLAGYAYALDRCSGKE